MGETTFKAKTEEREYIGQCSFQHYPRIACWYGIGLFLLTIFIYLILLFLFHFLLSSLFPVSNHCISDYDPEIGFKGLPIQWQGMLVGSGLTERDAAAAPDTFVATLKFHANYLHGVQPPSPAASVRAPGAPTPLGDEVPVSLEQLVSKEDPRSRFVSAAQDLIGAGGAAEVFLATVCFGLCWRRKGTLLIGWQ